MDSGAWRATKLSTQKTSIPTVNTVSIQTPPTSHLSYISLFSSSLPFPLDINQLYILSVCIDPIVRLVILHVTVFNVY